jgi:predicted nucleotidyltransferase
MRRKPKYTIEEIRQRVIPVAKQYDNIERVFLFGSYARGDARAKSDIDLRLDVRGGTGYFKLAEIYYDIEEALKTKVDILTTCALDEKFKTKIAKEEVLLYAG